MPVPATLGAEVTKVSRRCFWLLSGDEELAVPSWPARPRRSDEAGNFWRPRPRAAGGCRGAARKRCLTAPADPVSVHG